MGRTLDDVTTQEWDVVRVGRQSGKSGCIEAYVRNELDDLATREYNEAHDRGELNGLDAGGDYKQSEGKPRYDLIPADPLQEVAEVFTFGAGKYEDHRWREGIRAGALFAATMRHVWKWWMGEDADPESGISHLAHAVSNLMMAMGAETEGVLQDDRPV